MKLISLNVLAVIYKIKINLDKVDVPVVQWNETVTLTSLRSSCDFIDRETTPQIFNYLF